MNKGRRIGAVVAAAVAAVGMMTLGSISAAAAAPAGPAPVTTWLKPVKANTSTWVNLAWQTNRPACHAKIWVDGGRSVKVAYPSHRSFTSFSKGDSLSPRRGDVSAFVVTPVFSKPGVAMLRATIEYDNCLPRARKMRSTTALTLPVQRGGVFNNGGNDDHKGDDNHKGDDPKGNDDHKGDDHKGGDDHKDDHSKK
jgi:hypothetical protein